LNELLPERLNIVSMPVRFQEQSLLDRELMKDCRVRCEIQIASSSLSFFNTFNVFSFFVLFCYMLCACFAFEILRLADLDRTQNLV